LSLNHPLEQVKLVPGVIIALLIAAIAKYIEHILPIHLIGASLSIGTIVTVGKLSISVMIFTLLTCFGGGYVIGRLLGLNWKLSNLISAGTAVNYRRIFYGYCLIVKCIYF
jgi:hypothetical protein